MGEGVACVDPRLAALGARLLLPRATAGATLELAGFTPAEFEAYDLLRLELGVADGSRDLVPEKTLLLEAGFDELNGVDWNKGCYIGQELTARTKYRGLIKRRLLPVAVIGPSPAPGTPIYADGLEVGEMRSGRDGHGLALLRLDQLREPAWLAQRATPAHGRKRIDRSQPAGLDAFERARLSAQCPELEPV